MHRLVNAVVPERGPFASLQLFVVFLTLAWTAPLGTAQQGPLAGERVGSKAGTVDGGTVGTGGSTSARVALDDELLWDSWGVPHIYASTREQAFYQLGWAQMHAHADLIARLYGAARGQGAAHWGEQAFAEDALVSALGIPERAQAWLARQPADYRSYLEAFTSGLNDYAAAHPEAVRAINRWPLPFQSSDVLAHVQRILFTRFLFADADAVVTFQEHATRGPAARVRRQSGSNGYAIAPSRSASGESMLVINPHLPWADELTLFEAQISKGDSYVYGAALVGQPYLSMAFTPHGGWTHTVNAFDGLDTYELILRDDGYLLDGEVQPFKAEAPVQISVKQANGKQQVRTLRRVSSLHGPVVAIDARAHKALALRFTGTDSSDLVQRYWELADARTVSTFEAVSNRHRLPCFNTLYANREGDILFRYEGLMPRRSGGDFASWQGIQRGDSSATSWTSYYGPEALPRVLNPDAGFVQNANDPPWFASLPALDPARYPPYIAPPALDLRAQQSLRMVSTDSSIEFAELVAYKQQNHVELADRVLPDLLALVADEPALAPAAQLLATWDRSLSADARGALLFLAWVEAMGGVNDDWFKVPWSAREPLSTPRGLADPARARRALRRAAQGLKQAHGRLDPAYGDVYRLRRGKYDLPASTGSVRYGVYSAAEFEQAAGRKQVAWGGDTFVAVVSFGKHTRAEGLLVYGNASQPDSPHFGDQLTLFSQRKLRPLWLTRAEVEQHVERRERISAGAKVR